MEQKEEKSVGEPSKALQTRASKDLQREFLRPDIYREWKEKLGLSNPKYKLVTFDIASNMKEAGVTFLDVSKEIGEVEHKGYKYFYLIGVVINGTWLVPEKVSATAVFGLFDTRMTNVSAAKVATVTAKARNGDFKMVTRPNYPVSIRDFKRTSWALAHWIESSDVRNDVDVTACEIGFFYSLSKSAIMSSLKEGLTDASFDDAGRLSGTVSEDRVEQLCSRIEIQSQLYQLGITNKKKNKKEKNEKQEKDGSVKGDEVTERSRRHFEHITNSSNGV